MRRIVVATLNPGKVLELEKLLEEVPIQLLGLGDFDDIEEVEETGTTFVENAELKARSYAQQTNLSTLADDSGLEVAALNNAPGVFSARYSGANATDTKNTGKLLNELADAGVSNRDARFVCTMSISDQSGKILFTTSGYCNGTIAHQPRGTNGFGYDPVFIPSGFSETFGELSDHIKEKISHRGKAAKKIIRFLRKIAVS